MALSKDLTNSIGQMARTVAIGRYSIPKNKGHLYELYVYLSTYKVLRAKAGATLQNPAGGGFSFRAAPGLIDDSRFSYVVFHKNGRPYELRNDIEIRGFNMNHEIDISIFSGAQVGRPHKDDLLMGIECKNHAKLSSLKGEIRKYMGCVSDLTHRGHGSGGCIHCGIGFTALFACPLNASKNSSYTNYLQAYNLERYFDLKPNSTVETILEKEIIDLYNRLP